MLDRGLTGFTTIRQYYLISTPTEGKTMKVIPLEYVTDYTGQRLGIMFESLYVHEIPEDKHNRSYPHRFKVWTNLNRPNPDAGVVKWNGDTHGRYLDPHNDDTDSEQSFTISSECMVISAHGDGTGTAKGGQVWGDTVHVGDTITLQTPAGHTYGPFTVEFHRWNGLSLKPTE
jgi:hypothetical protein